ncbi:hypothetical protein EYF80_001590 [Liparis tanakae]|uniref:Uncharacterized protein n=1 Tax=Liparis tanakae TaxID=230148 RepID=A0A4Z2JCS1_9TELE|nr:hypothetical protein EYF80_001590 [Liparis tanakae]
MVRGWRRKKKKTFRSSDECYKKLLFEDLLSQKPHAGSRETGHGATVPRRHEATAPRSHMHMQATKFLCSCGTRQEEDEERRSKTKQPHINNSGLKTNLTEFSVDPYYLPVIR